MSRKQHKTNPTTLVDICILTAGRFDILRKCLEAAEREAKTVPSQIYLLDDASNKSVKIQNMDLFSHPNVRYKRLEQNVGFPAAYNELIGQGNSPLILVLTDDVVLQEGALDTLIRRMDDPTIGECGPKLIFPLDSQDPMRPAGKVQHVGLSCNLRGEPFHIFVGWDANHPRTNESKQVFALTGACFITRRSLFNKIGGFYEGYGKGTFEDIEYSLMVREAGLKVFLDAQAVGTHYTGATAEMLQQPFPLQYNHMLFRSRNAQRLFWSAALDW